MKELGILTSIRDFFSLETTKDSGLEPGRIEVTGVSKRFRKKTASRKSYSTIKSGLLRSENSKQSSVQQAADGNNYLQALDNLSISIAPGSAIGVIGRNGSGKSTLLKLISGIYLPDSGSVQKQGRISALIELGAGFHPDFSGRENVYLGGVMYGLTKAEIDARFEQIVAYAELEDFIDDPVRTYSSGMYMRLGFSLAVHTDPDILLIDEVLAVGDAGFIHRCHDTISDFKRRGKTLVFVTHDLPSVMRWCDQVIWLERGKIRDSGNPRRVIDAYVQAVEDQEKEKLNDENEELVSRPEAATPHLDVKSEDSKTLDFLDRALPSNLAEHEEPNRWGNGDVEITKVCLLSDSGQPSWLFSAEDAVTIEVSYLVHKPITELVFGIGIVRVDGLHVHGTNTLIDDLETPLPAEGVEFPVGGSYRYRISRLALTEDSYFVDVAIHREDGLPYDYHHRLHKFSVRNKAQAAGVFLPEHSWGFAPNYRPKELPEHGKLKVLGGQSR